MSDGPESNPSKASKAFAEAVEGLLANYFPDDVRAHLDGNLADAPIVPYEPNSLQTRALRQAGHDTGDVAGHVAARVLKTEIDQLRRDFERLERTQETQSQQVLTEGRVFGIVILLLGGLAGVLALLAFATGQL